MQAPLLPHFTEVETEAYRAGSTAVSQKVEPRYSWDLHPFLWLETPLSRRDAHLLLWPMPTGGRGPARVSGGAADHSLLLRSKTHSRSRPLSGD